MSSSRASEDGEMVADTPDVEKQERQEPAKKRDLKSRIVDFFTLAEGEVYRAHSEKNPKWYQRLLDAGAEENGVKPVPVDQRTSTKYNNMFTIFFTALLCLLPYVLGLNQYSAGLFAVAVC